eukprot:gene16067-22205_t
MSEELEKAAEWPGLTTLSSAQAAADLLPGLSLVGTIVPFKSFSHMHFLMQEFLEKNKILINEINKNHQIRSSDSLKRNVVLIKELNTNVGRVVDLYKELATQLEPESGSGPQAA